MQRQVAQGLAHTLLLALNAAAVARVFQLDADTALIARTFQAVGDGRPVHNPAAGDAVAPGSAGEVRRPVQGRGEAPVAVLRFRQPRAVLAVARAKAPLEL